MPVRQSTTGLHLVLLGMLLSACQKSPELDDINESVFAFGNFVEVQVLNIPAEKKPLILKAIERDLPYMSYAYHPWKSGPAGRTNQLLELAGEFTANPVMIPIILRSKEIAMKTDHLFNPAIGHLYTLWGYHGEFPPEGPPPEQQDIDALLQSSPTMASITVKGIRVDNSNPAVKLDLDGIARGYALDKVAEQLRMLGVQHAMINTGNRAKVLGQQQNQPWHIRIPHPREEGAIASLDVRDGEAVITTGDFENFYKYQGKRYHHILDPRTGYPADKTQSVTVIHTDATLADAAATAMFIAGPEQWIKIANDLGIDTAMLIDKQGKIHLTKKMQQRIQFEQADNDINLVSLK